MARARRLTPAGAGGVAVLEVTGEDALEAVFELAGKRPRVGSFALFVLEEAGELVDEALIWAESPRRCEVHLHGSPPLVAFVLERLGGAVQDNEARSLEEQASELLADAPSEAAARMLLDQAEGALRRELVSFAASSASERAARARDLLAQAEIGRRLLTPPRLVLAGPVNAGKSTLFNALVGSERALVHDEEGTTRDAVRARAQLGNYAVDVVDTAGERRLDGGNPAAGVERQGQVLARGLAEAADVVVWLQPLALRAEAPSAEPSDGKRLVLWSRADEVPAEPTAGMHPRAPVEAPLKAPAEAPRAPLISALQDPQGARSLLGRLVRQALGLPECPWVSGRAVPFASEQVEVLQGLAAEDPRALPRLAALLA